MRKLPSLTIGQNFDVLIVEDEPISRRALAALVTAKGYITDTVASAEDALKRVGANTKYKFVLVDLDLPGMSGIDLIRELERTSPQMFPVLITAAATEVVEEFRQQTPVAYLRKPLDLDQLLWLLHERQLRH